MQRNMRETNKIFKSLAVVLWLTVMAGFTAAFLWPARAAGLSLVNGRVLYNGQGLNGVKVYLVPEAEAAKMPEKVPDTRVVVGENGLTNQDGRYTITNVPEGKYRVYVFDDHAPARYLSRPGFWGALGEEGFTVGKGATTAPDISLTRAIKTQSPGNGEVVPAPPVEFNWEPCPGAVSYTLSVFDSHAKLLHAEKGLTSSSRKALFSWALGGVFSWQVTAYNGRGESIGQSLFPPNKRPVFLLGRPDHLPVLTSLTMGDSLKDDKIQNGGKRFLPADEKVVLLEEWTKAGQEHALIMRVYTPQGEQYHEIRNIIRAFPGAKTWQEIDIAGHRPAEIPGLWRLKFWVDEVLVQTETFEIAH